MSRPNPLPTFDVVDKIREELLALVVKHTASTSVRLLISNDEIQAFVDYCMHALQNCPESCRELVIATYSKVGAKRSEVVYEEQNLDLEQGKISPGFSVGIPISIGNHVPAQVDLEHLWGERFRIEFPVQTVKDSYVGSEPERIRPQEILVGFVQALYDEEWRRLHGRGATRHSADVNNEIHEVVMRHFSSPKDIKAWCDEQDNIAFRWRASTPPAVAYNTMASVRVHPADVKGAAPRWVHVHVPWLLRYSALITQLCVLADELEEADWQPEAKSYEERGKLCVWRFVDAEHPAMGPL